MLVAIFKMERQNAQNTDGRADDRPTFIPSYNNNNNNNRKFSNNKRKKRNNKKTQRQMEITLEEIIMLELVLQLTFAFES